MGEGPQTSEWIIWKGAIILCSTATKGNLANLPRRKVEQLEWLEELTWRLLSQIILVTVRWCGWPRRACQSTKEIDSEERACLGGVVGIAYSPLLLWPCNRVAFDCWSLIKKIVRPKFKETIIVSGEFIYGEQWFCNLGNWYNANMHSYLV